MRKFLSGLAVLLLVFVPAVALAQPAVVKSAVNIRTAPSSSKSKVIGALKKGDEITVSCSKGWCKLADGRGYVAQSFLRLGAGGGGGSAAKPAAESEQVATAAPATEAPAPAEPPKPETGGIFDGMWNAKTDRGIEAPLSIAQIETDAEATMVSGDITTKMTGRIEGMRYIFTWQNVRDGQVLIEGDGFLNFVGDNALSGALMQNGTLVASIQAGR